MSLYDGFVDAARIGELTESFIGTGAATERIAFELNTDGEPSPFSGFQRPANLTTEPSGNFMDVDGTEANMTTAPEV